MREIMVTFSYPYSESPLSLLDMMGNDVTAMTSSLPAFSVTICESHTAPVAPVWFSMGNGCSIKPSCCNTSPIARAVVSHPLPGSAGATSVTGLPPGYSSPPPPAPSAHPMAPSATSAATSSSHRHTEHLLFIPFPFPRYSPHEAAYHSPMSLLACGIRRLYRHVLTTI